MRGVLLVVLFLVMKSAIARKSSAVMRSGIPVVRSVGSCCECTSASLRSVMLIASGLYVASVCIAVGSVAMGMKMSESTSMIVRSAVLVRSAYSSLVAMSPMNSPMLVIASVVRKNAIMVPGIVSVPVTPRSVMSVVMIPAWRSVTSIPVV